MGTILIILAGIALCGALVLLMVCCVLLDKSNKQAKERAALAPTDEAPQQETFDASVVDLQCRVVTLGERSVKTVSEYLVFFQRTDGLSPKNRGKILHLPSLYYSVAQIATKSDNLPFGG